MDVRTYLMKGIGDKIIQRLNVSPPTHTLMLAAASARIVETVLLILRWRATSSGQKQTKDA
jgi:hypothetical protein